MERSESRTCSNRTSPAIRFRRAHSLRTTESREQRERPMTNPPGDAPEQPPTTPIVSWEAPTEAAGPAPGVTFAGFGARLVAYIIDAIIIGIVATVIAL